MNLSAMNFPFWEFSGINGGLLIAIIAVIHVFVAQFAVGGGFFLVFAERKGHREGSARILKWVHRHTKFFLLLTMVFGGLTGVGIWLVISLVSPAGTSLLVREFLYAWAAEWVFFLGEIIALILYAASFARCREGLMRPRDHMLLGIGYCVFAFLSLFIINGIVTFMLTPGDWVNTGNFWSALFNPGFWPALVFRSGLALTLSGLFGLVTATAITDAETRAAMVRFCAQWICLPFIVMVLGALWYFSSLPDAVVQSIQRRTDDIRPFVRSFLDTAPLLFLAGLFLFIRLPQKAYRPYVLVVMLLGLTVAGSFEWIRETSRRPWLVHGYMYSNGITLADGKIMNEKGVLHTSGWAQSRTLSDRPGTSQKWDKYMEDVTAASLSPEERRKFGRFLFTQQCSSCHGLNAPMLNIVPRVEGRGIAGVTALLNAQGIISPYMPPVFGTDEERRILAEWLANLKSTE